MLAYNFNNYVWFQLGENGRQVLENYIKQEVEELNLSTDLEQAIRRNYSPCDNGYYKMQMHEMMQIFGNKLCGGKEVFIHGLIYFDEKYLLDEAQQKSRKGV